MRIAVIGLGLIGGSIAIDLKRSGFAKEVIGVDASLEHCKQALELAIVDRLEPLPVAVQDADLVILAVPVGAMVSMLPGILDLSMDGTTITDMGSTKEQVSRAVENHPKRRNYVASHPMAGTENSGPQAALEGLFMGKTAVICDPDKSDPRHLKIVRDMYHALGMRLIEMAASEHDLKVAFVSHLSHLSSFALANVVLDKEKNVNTIFDLAGGGFESTVRLAKSSPEMWLPIFDQNRENILDALDGYIDHLYRFREGIAALSGPESEEKQQCLALMKNANQIRRVLKKG
ncbi:MAG: prephenate dehydrogenase [Bdellovibrionia bacterium]